MGATGLPLEYELSDRLIPGKGAIRAHALRHERAEIFRNRGAFGVLLGRLDHLLNSGGHVFESPRR